MYKKRSLKFLIAFVVIVSVAGTAGFLVGQNVLTSKYQSERELNYRLNRSELDGLGEINGTIYVTGHKSPDADTVGSSIAYAALLQKLGYDARAVVLGGVNNETKYILASGGIEAPMMFSDASDCNMVLVDHSDYTHSAKGLQNAKVISIIDHHGDGSVITGNQIIYDARPLGSTATIIWIRYHNYGIEIEPHVAYAMVGSILSDTNNLTANTTTFADREALKELSKIAGIIDTDAMYQEMFQASLSYDGMTDEEIFFNDYKEYESNGTKYAIGCINAYDEESAKDLAKRIKKILPTAQTSKGMDLSFAQIRIFHDNISITHLVPSNEAAKEVIKNAFGNDAVYDGISYRLEPSISRKQVLVPAITEILQF